MKNILRSILLGGLLFTAGCTRDPGPVFVTASRGTDYPTEGHVDGGVFFREGSTSGTNYIDRGFRGKLSEVQYFENDGTTCVRIMENDSRLNSFIPKYLELREKATKGN